MMKNFKISKTSSIIIKRILVIAGTILAALLSVIAVLLCCSIHWMFSTWSNLTMDELMYHIKAPLDGTNQSMIWDYISACVTPTVLVIFLMVILFVAFRKKKKAYRIIMGGAVVVSLSLTIGFVTNAWNTLDIGNYAENQGTYSGFVDTYYVDPKSVEITFPEKKRNLIYIFLESMETTYADEENGGAFLENCIPELTELARQNVDFSGESDKLNGGYALPGATWTVAAMFSQSAGIPLNISIEENSMDTQDAFFPDVVTLGDILQQAGYNQTLLVGSDATFGGRKLLYTDHGNFDIIDYPYALSNGMLPQGYGVWWGYEDSKLIQFAKEQLNELSNKEEPFNLTMLTVDTHFEDGYPCEDCPDTFDDQYANVMACSSRQISEFVNWIQQQAFYEDTTIVISGDHPTMDSDFCEDVPADYTRKVYTTYINAPVTPETTEMRNYSTFDNYPTTLAGLGVTIEGNRLGLGTNLFSAEQTLLERFGKDGMSSELSKKSKKLEELGSINENSEELRMRFGDTAEAAPEAGLAVGDYDAETEQLPVIVSDIVDPGNGIESVLLAVWTAQDQSDLLWTQTGLQSDGTYYGNLYIPADAFANGTYIIDAYVVDGDGTPHIIGEINGSM